MAKEILSVTFAIEKVKKMIWLCDKVADNSRKVKRLIKEMNEKEKKKVNEKGLMNKKRSIYEK